MQTCVQCGKENPDEAIQCYGCGTEFEVAKSSVVKLTQAGFRIRALARVIDMIFCTAMVYLAVHSSGNILLALVNAGVVSPDWYYHAPRFSLIVVIFGIVAKVSYHSLCEGLHGATLGKFICRIRVVHQDGKPSTLPGAFIRSIAYLWDCQFLGAAGYYGSMEKSPLNQRYGDVWGKTLVLKNTEINQQNNRPISRFFLGLVWGAASYLALIILGLILAARYLA